MNRLKNLITLLILACSACKPAASNDLNVSLEKQGPKNSMRIVSRSPGITANLLELGLGDQLVGVSNYCRDVNGVQDFSKRKIGDLRNINIPG